MFLHDKLFDNLLTESLKIGQTLQTSKDQIKVKRSQQDTESASMQTLSGFNFQSSIYLHLKPDIPVSVFVSTFTAHYPFYPFYYVSKTGPPLTPFQTELGRVIAKS